MPELTVTAGVETDPHGPETGLHTGCGLAVGPNLDLRLASALEHAVEAVKDEQQRQLVADRSDLKVVTEVVEPETHTVDTNTDSRLAFDELLDTRATGLVDTVRDQLDRRASDLDLLNDDELTGLMRSLLLTDSVTSTVEAHAAGLEQQAANERAAIERVGDALRDRYPDLADHVADVVSGRVGVAEAFDLALDILGCDVGSITELAARADDTSLDPAVQEAARFDAHLAMAYADRLVAEQVDAARNAIDADTLQLPINGQERKTVEALLAIGDQLAPQPPAVREAVESYYQVLAAGDSHVVARDVVDQLLASPDQGLLDYLVTLKQERRHDGLVQRALSEDPVISARARQQIEQSGIEPEGRPPRVSPITDDCLDPQNLGFHLATAEAADAFNAALLQRQDIGLAVDLHAEARMRAAYTVLHLVDELREQGRIAADSAVTIAGAVYQLGKGSVLEDTNAAHKLPGQVYIGVDPDRFASMTQDERRAYRLDSLLEYDTELQRLAQFQAASTTVLPRYVNDADSDWEAAGLRGALAGAIAGLLDPNASTTVADAYEAFRTNAATALDAARMDNDAAFARLEATRAADAALTLVEQQQLRTIMVLDQYRDALAAMDAQRAYQDLQEWLATIERNRQEP